LSKRVVRLPDPSIVDWFARHMADAMSDRNDDERDDALWNELGGYVYGLASIFSAAKKHRFELPSTMSQLRTLLHRHLYVEGGDENIAVDEHSVRVLTDNDEVQLAYFFFEADALTKHPDRLAWLLHDEPRLPATAGESSEQLAAELTAGLPSFTPKALGAGATYACLFTFYDGESLPGKVGVFEGVRLPQLAEHLREVRPDTTVATWSKEYLETWPLELRVLRAMIEPHDTVLAPALERLQRLPLSYFGSETNNTRTGVGPYVTARAEFEKLAGARGVDTDASQSIIDEHPHALLFAMHASSSFGHQQWILFDDLWAAAHVDLARSLLRYGTRWDPLEEP
jgi:hypothetical protein